ncbi:hypothetical protein M9H77_03958 [Catharanthus roseus]|uniref:Uncharacterized protein n=1 Tax=Catharanthus roseus TaxID=4058 RepID=A0ACC0CCS0_CATRO|nr:hypothetical protein M9H77_03958 [Catharanthus roseus]
MAVPWSMTLWLAKMVWLALSGWVVSCLSVADEIANTLRNGDIGPFHMYKVHFVCGNISSLHWLDFVEEDLCKSIVNERTKDGLSLGIDQLRNSVDRKIGSL